MESEKDVETRLRDGIKRLGGLCLKWVSPGANGVPDRIILLPGGRVCFAELKRPKGGRLSGLQKYFKRVLIRLGFQCETVWSFREADDLLHRLEVTQNEIQSLSVPRDSDPMDT